MRRASSRLAVVTRHFSCRFARPCHPCRRCQDGRFHFGRTNGKYHPNFVSVVRCLVESFSGEQDRNTLSCGEFFSLPIPSRFPHRVPMSVEVTNEHDKPPTRFSWLKAKQSEKLDSASLSSADNRASPDLRLSPPVEDTPKSVSLLGLFRYFFFFPPFLLFPYHLPASPPALSVF